MKLLLDTHIWIWAVQRPDRIGHRTQRELERSTNELYLSPISIWEAGHLNRKRKWGLRIPFSIWVHEALQRLPIQEASFNFAVASQASAIHLPQSDIGDVLLAATALAFDLTLVTTDSQLLACKWLKTISND